MKSLFYFLVIVTILPLAAGGRQYLSENEKYKNSSQNSVFIILELPPGATFKNKSNYRFHIVKEYELLHFTANLRRQIAIDSIRNELACKQAELDSLHKKYEAVQ